MHLNIFNIRYILCLFGKHKWCYGLNDDGELDYNEADNERRFCECCGKEQHRVHESLTSHKHSAWENL